MICWTLFPLANLVRFDQSVVLGSGSILLRGMLLRTDHINVSHHYIGSLEEDLASPHESSLSSHSLSFQNPLRSQLLIPTQAYTWHMTCKRTLTRNPDTIPSLCK